MNIAFYANDVSLLAGTERATFQVANELAKHSDIKVFIFSTVGERQDIKMALDNRIEVVSLNYVNRYFGYFNNILKLNKLLKKYEINHFITVEMMSILFTLPTIIFRNKSRSNFKYYAWEHFNYTVDLGRSIRSLCRKMAAKFADGIIVLTERDVEQWRSNVKINGKIENISNPCSMEIVPRQYPVQNNNIIAVGRLTYQKGFDILLSIWKDFLNQYEVPKEWMLQIVGDGEDKQKLLTFIEEHTLGDRVELISNTSDIKSLYLNSSFLAMTSRFEGLPMTLIEAQTLGLPIIAFDCITGPAEVVTEGTGYLIPYDDSELFKAKLFDLISSDTDRSKMSVEAFKQAQRFKSSQIGSRWIEFLRCVSND
ncbi:glycosyltransferase family 4 protein [Sphingobacterium sp. UBA6645]|uniref:glycosyltransferase family 4 protein n=1 Tax=Sphingobacterium sp. UBA6645 TaxID=1947511 RepID=UPI0025E8F03C|nr:glycosyltransferase family 4 protein [Sphingobacterium sp. UBA6645]